MNATHAGAWLSSAQALGSAQLSSAPALAWAGSVAAGRPKTPLPHVLQRKRRLLPLSLSLSRPLPRPRATRLPVHATAAPRGAAGSAAATRPAAATAGAGCAAR